LTSSDIAHLKMMPIVSIDESNGDDVADQADEDGVLHDDHIDAVATCTAEHTARHVTPSQYEVTSSRRTLGTFQVVSRFQTPESS
jgi:hypothetical protein